VRGDGDGWVHAADGSRRWGLHGAAGLLLRAPGPDGTVVLLQHRAVWSHHGGTWGIPGGARDSDETPVQGALREAAEEAGLRAGDVAVRTARVTAGHEAGWSYTTVVADAASPLALTADHESDELRWVLEDDVDAVPLHPSFALAWPRLRARPVQLLLDTANLLGSRPDGWWRDRAGATTTLLRRVGHAVPRTVELPDGSFVRVEGVAAVVEGAARTVDVEGARLHRAPGSGDDELVRVATGDHLVVTADRGLRARLGAGVAVVGPSAVHAWLGELARLQEPDQRWSTLERRPGEV
jgi:8-oxo-dGTP diphosphatase